jgi:hypothetical protein
VITTRCQRDAGAFAVLRDRWFARGYGIAGGALRVYKSGGKFQGHGHRQNKNLNAETPRRREEQLPRMKTDEHRWKFSLLSVLIGLHLWQ